MAAQDRLHLSDNKLLKDEANNKGGRKMFEKSKACANSMSCRFRFAMRLAIVLTLIGIGIAWYLH